MTERQSRMFGWSGADFGEMQIPAYRHHPAQRAARNFRKAVARRARKYEKRAVAGEVDRELNEPWQDPDAHAGPMDGWIESTQPRGG